MVLRPSDKDISDDTVVVFDGGERGQSIMISDYRLE